MKTHRQLSQEHKNLIRRYLLWAYKSTKESFERIERKTTQLLIDEYLLAHLAKKGARIPDEFKEYIAQKRKDEKKLKFTDTGGKELHPEYVYLKNRLAAIEAAIKYFLGTKELKNISKLYEVEFTRRILEARDH